VTVAQYGFLADPGGFSYNNVDHVATWTLNQDISQPDKLRIDLDGDTGGVTDTAGILLDGEWTDASDTYPSGNDVPGGDFRFRFNVLPGDADQSGQVRTLDWRNIRLQLGAVPGDANYSIFYDVDGSGRIRTLDWRNARLRLGDQLPTGDPGPPPSATMVGGNYDGATDAALMSSFDPRAGRIEPLDNRAQHSVWDEALLMILGEEVDEPEGNEKEVSGGLLAVLWPEI
jgi:hypothetical protein